MKCPNCNHTAGTALLKCSACGETYERNALELYQHLEYLLKWLDAREQDADLKADVYERLHAKASKEFSTAALHLTPAPAPTPPAVASSRVDSINQALSLIEAARKRIDGWVEAQVLSADSAETLTRHMENRSAELNALLDSASIHIEPAAEAQTTQYVAGTIKLWVKNAFITEAEGQRLNNYLLGVMPPVKPAAPVMATPAPVLQPELASAPNVLPLPKPVTPPAPPPTPKAPVPAPAKPAPAKPAQPPINWNKVWEQTWELVVSGALLRGLLYLGAFMIVISAVVLVVAYWQLFPWPLQLGFISSVPLAFYLSGYVLRARLKIPVAGGVFTGIGAVLVAVDFAAVYQIGGLRSQMDVQWYWMIASVACTAIYVFTAWRVRGEFFAYLTNIAFTSTVVAITAVLNWPLEWRIASITASGTALFGAAVMMRNKTGDAWQDAATASRRLPHVLIPISLFLILLVPGEPAFGQMLAFGFAAAGYGVVAAFFPNKVWVHLAAWCSVAAVGFGLKGAHVPTEWYASVAATLAPMYLLTGRWLRSVITTDERPRWGYAWALYLTGFGLVAAAVATGFITLIVDIWAGVIALSLASAVLGWCAYFFRRPAFTFLASGLFIIPFTVAVARWLYLAENPQIGAWLMAAWMGLALTYLSVAALLRRADSYGTWFTVWAHGLALLALLELLFDYALFPRGWVNTPTLVALGGAIAVYLASAVLHDTGRYPALSRWANALPAPLNQAFFLWPIGILLPVWVAIAWWGSVLDTYWLGAVLGGMSLLYVGVGQLLKRHKPVYVLPPHALAYGVGLAGVLVAMGSQLPLVTALVLAVGTLAALGRIYRRTLETSLAGALFLWPFHLSLQLLNVMPHAFSLAYALLASLGYIPLGLLLDKANRKYALPQYAIGYGLAAVSVVASLAGRFNLYSENVPWVGVAVPLVVTGLQIFSLYRFRQTAFAWAAVSVFAIAFGQALTLLQVSPAYDPLAWVGLAFVYMLVERSLVPTVTIGSWGDVSRERSQAFRWPLGIGAIGLGVLGLILTGSATLSTFTVWMLNDPLPTLLAQLLGLGLLVVAARLYRSRWPLFVEPVVAFVAVSVFFIGYGNLLFGRLLTPVQYCLVSSVLGIVHLTAAALLDRQRVRYSHGLYLGGYGLAAFAVMWSLTAQDVLVWTLGLQLLIAVASAFLVHFNHHRTWDELLGINAETLQTSLVKTARGAFIWLAAWMLPAWCALLLVQLNVVDGFQWLGFGVTALFMLGLAVGLRRVERTYAWPLHAASQFYILLGLALTTSITLRLLGGRQYVNEGEFALAFIALQAIAVIFYAASAWAHQTRLFAHVAAGLVFVPYTLAWIRFGPILTSTQFALVWVGLAGALLLTGVLLDRHRVRYAHGPYGAGYLLAGFALAWSLPDVVTNIYTLAAVLLMALASHALMHYGQHRSFDDLMRFIWRTEGTVGRRVAQTAFLFFAAYAFPVWLAQVMAYNNVPLAWRGLGLALAAPIYIAFGLAARRVRREYTWPLYSAGYALTAIGAMLAFNNEAIAIYVLALNAVVYAASAYIFRQSFWLYLSNSLVPVIAILLLHYNQMQTAPWVASVLMVLAFVYFGVAQWFQQRALNVDDRLEKTISMGRTQGGAPGRAREVGSFALAFLAPAYVLSAVAMAAASGDKWLAMEIYLAGVVLYGLSAWVWREPVFLYPAVGLAAVPYYVAMTLTPLPAAWYGVGWMPLIVTCIVTGRFVFHRTPLGSFRAAVRAVWHDTDTTGSKNAFVHPALPFYLLAYGLSVSMLVLSQGTPLIFTVALALAALLYFISAALFHRPVWLYPGLLAAHLGLVTYFAINPTNTPPQYLSLPFLGFTWLVALAGYAFSLYRPVVWQGNDGQRLFKFSRWQLQFGNLPIVGHLITPSWAQPFFFFTALDVLFWQWVALGRYETAIIVALGFMLLLIWFATRWQDAALAYDSLALFVLAAGYRFAWAGMPWPEWVASMGGVGLGLYLLARLAERVAATPAEGTVVNRFADMGVWLKPLTYSAIALTGLAAVSTLPAVINYPVATAASLAFAGILYLSIAFRGHYYQLGYAALALLQFAWVLLLRYVNAGEPELFAIPAGLYFVGMGYLERRRSRKWFAILVETFGLTILLLTAFIQSLYGGSAGLPYFVLLLVEGLLVIGWGAWRRLKIPFFIGLGANALNVAGQIVVLFGGGSTLTRWAIIGSAGLLLVFAAVLVERQRALIIAKAQEWREALETWD